MEPADGLADLVATEYPKIRLSDVTLAPATRARLERVLQEQRQRDHRARPCGPTHGCRVTGFAAGVNPGPVTTKPARRSLA